MSCSYDVYDLFVDTIKSFIPDYEYTEPSAKVFNNILNPTIKFFILDYKYTEQSTKVLNQTKTIVYW